VHDLQGAEVTIGVFVALIVSWWLLCSKLASYLPVPDRSTKQSLDAGAMTAKHILSGLCNTFYGCTGFVLWFFTTGPRLAVSHETRAYGYAGDFWQTCLWAMIGYQLWDLAVCLAVPSLRSPASLGHHSLTALLTYLCTYPYIHYYSLFFVGVSEVSTIALAVMDIFKVLPHLAERYPVANGNARIAFAVLFLLIRVLYWPTVCYSFWMDSLVLLNSSAPHSTASVMTFLLANTLLTLLQFYWGYLVILGIMKKFGKSSIKKKVKS